MPPKAKAKAKGKGKAGAKGKAGSKGKAKRKGGEGADPGAAEDAARAAAEEEAARTLRQALRGVDAETARETALLNEYRVQKEMTAQFWEHEKERREALKLALRERERAREDLEERQAFELKVYKTKVKNLLYEQQTAMTEAKTDCEAGLKQRQVGQRDEEHQQFLDARSLKRLRKEMAAAHGDLVNDLREEQAKAFRALREEYEQRANELVALSRERERAARGATDAAKTRDIKKIVLEKDRRTMRLMMEHKKAFDAIKTYYRDITHSNLDLIKTLKDELARLRSSDAQRQKQLGDTKRYHQKLVQPLQENLHLLEELKGDLQVHERNVTELSVVNDRLAVVEDSLRQLSWDSEVLRQRTEQAELERDELREKLSDSLLEVQQKAGFRRLLLQKKIGALADDLEKTEAALAEVLASTSLRPEVVGDIRRNLQDVIEAKNADIKSLEGRINDLRTYYYDTVHAYEECMLAHNVPLEEIPAADV